MKILKRILIWIGSILGGLLLLAIIVPMIWPIPVLTGIQTIDQLKDSNSQFINLEGINVHYKQYGNGEPYIILLHGFGASTFTWRDVIQPLSKYGTVIAYNRPSSGLTDRPWKMTWDGLDPYGVDGQVQMLLKLMDAKGIQKAILIGNSAGGAIATYAVWQYPDRVQALVELGIVHTRGGENWTAADEIDPKVGRGFSTFRLVRPGKDHRCRPGRLRETLACSGLGQRII